MNCRKTTLRDHRIPMNRSNRTILIASGLKYELQLVPNGTHETGDIKSRSKKHDTLNYAVRGVASKDLMETKKNYRLLKTKFCAQHTWFDYRIETLFFFKHPRKNTCRRRDLNPWPSAGQLLSPLRYGCRNLSG